MNVDYVGIIHKDNDSDFGVSFPDFLGCVSAGSTLQEAMNNGKEALNFHIEGMKEDGEALPPPSTLDTIAKSPNFADGVAFIVPIKQEDKTVRINITMTKSELDKIDQAASAHGMKRSTYLVKSGIEAA